VKTLSRHRLPLILLLMLIAATIGCRKGEPRGDVSGEVTFNGKPIEMGLVAFEPAQATLQPRNASIQDGRYRADGAAGLKPGVYCVRITAPDLSKARATSKDINDLLDFTPLLPPAWNAQSKLSVEVKAGKNTFYFHGNKGEQPSVEIGVKD
jgi:hypothetical protein